MSEENKDRSCYELLCNKIKELFFEGNDANRNKFAWYKERFQLEFPLKDRYKKMYLRFLFGEMNEEDLKSKIECLTKERLKELLKIKTHEELSVFLAEERENVNLNEVNEYWKNNPIEFIEKTENYRENGTLDEHIKKQTLKLASTINEDGLRFVYEIIQNADDCYYGNENEKQIEIDFSDKNRLKFFYNEEGMTYLDILSITTIGDSNKNNKKKKRMIGEKGIGFKTIFSVFANVEIYSGAFKFKLSGLSPENIVHDERKEKTGTLLILNRSEIVDMNKKDKATEIDDKEKKNKNIKNVEDNHVLFDAVLEKYGLKTQEGKIDNEATFKNCPVLFTQNINSIILKKENEEYQIKRLPDRLETYYNGTLMTKIDFFRYERNLEFSWEEYNSRYPNQFAEAEFDSLEDRNVITYQLAVIFPKDKSIKTGSVYSFFPTDIGICAPFSIQVPIKLSLDRGSMWFMGDPDTKEGGGSRDNDSLETLAWNNRIFDEMFFKENSLIKEAYNSLKRELENSDSNIFDYIPNFEDNELLLFKHRDLAKVNIDRFNQYFTRGKLVREGRTLGTVFKEIEYFKVYENDDYVKFDEAVMFDKFIHEVFYKEYFNVFNEDTDLKGKCLVEFKDNALAKAKCLGFEYQEVSKEDRAKYINLVLNGITNESEKISKIQKIMEEICKGKKECSMYLPEPDRYSDLNIYPTDTKSGNLRYIDITNHIWFKFKNDIPSDFLGFWNEDNPRLKNYESLLKDNSSLRKGIEEVQEIEELLEKFVRNREFFRGKKRTDNDESMTMFDIFKEILNLGRSKDDDEFWFSFAKEQLKKGEKGKIAKVMKEIINEFGKNFIEELKGVSNE